MTTFEEWRARGTDLEVGGLRLAIHDDGDPTGPVVTFLHGYPSSSLDVVPLLDRLDGVRVVSLDLPGFGASAKPIDHSYSIHGAVDAVEAMWAALGVARTVLVVHDYSVSLGQELLARDADAAAAGTPRPVAIDGVVWTNGGVYPELHRPTDGQKLLLDPEHGRAFAEAMDEAAFTGGVGTTWGTRRPLDEHEVHEMWAALAHDGGSRLAHDLLHYVADRREHAERWQAALETSPVPMRFVWGELDPVSGAHMADRLAARRPDADLVRLADVGHWPPLEAPDEVAAATRDLLDRA